MLCIVAGSKSFEQSEIRTTTRQKRLQSYNKKMTCARTFAILHAFIAKILQIYFNFCLAYVQKKAYLCTRF